MRYLSALLARYPDRAWFFMLALGAFGVVAVGMTLQSMLRLAPCPYCIFQRLLYLVLGGVALCGALAPQGRAIWAAAGALVGALGFAVAAFQSWMQAFPELAPECSFTDPNLIERLVDWLGMQWPAWFLATGFCTSREWEMFGLSMANWSAVLFAGITGFCVLLAMQRSR